MRSARGAARASPGESSPAGKAADCGNARVDSQDYSCDLIDPMATGAINDLPRIRTTPARGRLFRPTRPPLSKTRPGGASDSCARPAYSTRIGQGRRLPTSCCTGSTGGRVLVPEPWRSRPPARPAPRSGEPFERTTHEGALDAPHAPRPEDPYAGGGMGVAAGRPMDRTRGMGNSPDAFAADCTAVEARFPHRLDHRPPAGPQPPVHVGQLARRCAVARPHAAASVVSPSR